MECLLSTELSVSLLFYDCHHYVSCQPALNGILLWSRKGSQDIISQQRPCTVDNCFAEPISSIENLQSNCFSQSDLCQIFLQCHGDLRHTTSFSFTYLFPIANNRQDLADLGRLHFPISQQLFFQGTRVLSWTASVEHRNGCLLKSSSIIIYSTFTRRHLQLLHLSLHM